MSYPPIHSYLDQFNLNANCIRTPAIFTSNLRDVNETSWGEGKVHEYDWVVGITYPSPIFLSSSYFSIILINLV